MEYQEKHILMQVFCKKTLTFRKVNGDIETDNIKTSTK